MVASAAGLPRLPGGAEGSAQIVTTKRCVWWCISRFLKIVYIANYNSVYRKWYAKQPKVGPVPKPGGGGCISCGATEASRWCKGRCRRCYEKEVYERYIRNMVFDSILNK